MTDPTRNFSRLVWGATMQVTLALLLVIFGASAALAQTRAYVTNIDDNTVSVIDTTTNTVVATVPVGEGAFTVAVTPNGAFAYVVNRFDRNVMVIDTSTNTVVATVPVGNGAAEAAITPNGAFIYVTNQNDNNVSVIATATNTVTATVPVGLSPIGIDITPNGAFAWVMNLVSGSISVIDTATNTVAATIPGIPSPINIAFTPTGAFAYVTSSDDVVLLINTATNTVAATIPVEDPGGIDITPNGDFVYVTNFFGDTVSVINTATNTVVATVPGFMAPEGVAVNPEGTFVYVTNRTGDNVSLISTATNTVTITIPVGDNPSGIAFPSFPPLPPSQLDLIDDLIAQVEALFAGGSLTQKQRDTLIAKLEDARTKIIAGQTNTGINQLSTFIHQVNALANNNTLTAAQVQALVDQALFIQASLAPPIEINSCTTINALGFYKLVANLTASSTCITINASNVSLDLNGHTISGPGTGSNASGILAVGETNLTIEGPGTITNFTSGVEFAGVDFSRVKSITSIGNRFGFIVNRDFVTPDLNNLSEGNTFNDNTASGNEQHGFTLNGASNNSFLNNVASNNGVTGMLLFDGVGNEVSGNTTNGNGDSGIMVNGGGVSTAHTITGNTASGNSILGIHLAGGSTGNTVSGNTAQGNFFLDLLDENFECESNTWTNNVFDFAEPPCIQ